MINNSLCQRFAFLLILIVLISCDPIFYARINNKTKNEIVLEFQFDKSEIQNVRGTYLLGILKGGGEILCFDSITLISKILLKPNEFFTIEHNIGYRPKFFGIKKIQIVKNDTITLDGKESIIKSFRETSSRQFNLDIK